MIQLTRLIVYLRSLGFYTIVHQFDKEYCSLLFSRFTRRMNKRYKEIMFIFNAHYFRMKKYELRSLLRNTT